MDGKFTLNENVCDIDGLNVASKAFSDLREASANDLVHLPNNPYTPQQLFFINTAQVIFLCILAGYLERVNRMSSDKITLKQS